MYRQPKYEQERDRAVQTVVQDFLQIQTSWHCPDLRLTQTPVGAHVDYMWHRGDQLVHVGELKRRNFTHDHWPEYMISASKVHAIQRYAELGWILVLFKDGLFRIPVRRGMDVVMKRGGRTTQSRDSWEAGGELCAYFTPLDMHRFHMWTDMWQRRAQKALRAS